jgi:hypothetical protein
MRVTLKKRYYQRALDLGLVGKVVTCTRNEGFEDKRVVLHGFRTDHEHGGTFEAVVSPADSPAPYGGLICSLVHVSRIVELRP